MNPNKPAFPYEMSSQSGITIRDYIAIEAMKAIITANPKKNPLIKIPEEKQVTTLAYIFSDALIAESNKK